MFTTTGMNNLLQYGTEKLAYLAVGNGTAAKSESDTALESEVERIAVDALNIVANEVCIEAMFTNSQAIDDALTEWGIFDLSSGGTMQIGDLFDNPIEKTAQKPLTVSITEVLANG